jgi:hypothetical protein
MKKNKCKERWGMNSDQSIAPVTPGSIDNQNRISEKEQ